MTCIQWHMAGSVIMRIGRDTRGHKLIKGVNAWRGHTYSKHTGGYFCRLLHQTVYLWWKSPNKDLDLDEGESPA